MKAVTRPASRLLDMSWSYPAARVCRAVSRRWAARWTAPGSTLADPWNALIVELDRWTGAPAVLWWRDDDAVAASPALDRLLALRAAVGIPLAIASIPATAQASLAQALATSSDIRVLAHGWDHRNHAPHGAPTAELAAGRDRNTVLTELRTGRERLAELFSTRFLPVLVPPYNRIDRALVSVVCQAGFRAISIDWDFAGLAMPCRNVHIDVNDWRRGTAMEAMQAVRTLVGALRLRRLGLVGRLAPIGVLTHHLAHDEASWELARSLLERLRAHRSVIFAPIEEIFAT
jgi:peptidoglycan/xylan/chitin deacetylase (PgdA/CDA1 family)